MVTSVVIPVRNGAATLAEQLEALAQQEYDDEWEVVVADNGSSDATREVVNGFRDLPQLRVVDASGGSGAGYRAERRCLSRSR